MSVIINPIEQYFDLDGNPLENGYLYFGEVFGNPITQPVMVYFDPEFTIPAAQPVRTVNGYPVRSGTATGLFSQQDVSILIQNNKKEQVLFVESSNINVSQNTTFYRDSDTTLNADDNNKTFIFLSSFTQTFDAAVNLGDRWRVNLINMSSGNVNLDPNLSETIDGLASLQLQPNSMLTVYCDGVNLETTSNVYPSTSVASANIVDLRGVNPKVITLTGSTTINTVQMLNGDKFTVIVQGTPTITNSGTLIVEGGVNYLGKVGDILTFTKDATANNVYVQTPFSNSGVIFDWGAPTAPPGAMALPLVPTNISRTTYAGIFARYGTTWGNGDGSTTFGSPYCPENYAIVSANANVGTSTVGEVISHSHIQRYSDGAAGTGGTNLLGAIPSTTATGTTGGSANLAAGIRMLKCIWL